MGNHCLTSDSSDKNYLCKLWIFCKLNTDYYSNKRSLFEGEKFRKILFTIEFRPEF